MPGHVELRIAVGTDVGTAKDQRTLGTTHDTRHAWNGPNEHQRMSTTVEEHRASFGGAPYGHAVNVVLPTSVFSGLWWQR
jgi:hypothetical protein